MVALRGDRYYRLAEDHECGLMYRPGELSIPSLHYCRLDKGHGGIYHSTRTHEHDPAGYEWEMYSRPSPVDWPRR